MIEEKWRDYARAWSQPDDTREALLNTLVADDVTYADPQSDVAGRDAFSAHMAQFQTDIPGAHFEILDVKFHHNRSLARWSLRGHDGAEMMQGTSFAALAEDGKFLSFSGFF